MLAVASACSQARSGTAQAKRKEKNFLMLESRLDWDFSEVAVCICASVEIYERIISTV